VDRSCFNAARIVKVLGTVARKGDDLPDRPHRQSCFIPPKDAVEIVPVALLRAAAAWVPCEPKSESRGSDSAKTNPFVLDRAEKYLSKMEPSIAGQKGHDRLLMAAGAMVRGFDLSDSEAFELLDREFNPRCVPPWSAYEIDHKIFEARKAGKPFGHLLDEGSNPAKSDWDDPVPLSDPLVEVMPYSNDLLPPVVGDVVDDIAERMQCPPDFAAASMLVALAAVIGCRIGIRPRRCDDWLVVPNLWGCVIGRPSMKKSPAIGHAEKRIRAIEARERERLAEEVKGFKVDQVLAESKSKSLKSKIEKALKSGDEDQARELAFELTEVEQSKPPIPRRIITTDSTIEKLGDMLNLYPDGMLLWVDELVGWMRALDRQDMAGVRQQFLTLWNGQGRLNIDRVGRGETVVEHPCLSLFGCATPGGISDYVTAALRGGRGDDGLIQRLQILVWPDSPKEYKHVDRFPDSQSRKNLIEMFESLADLDVDSFAERDEFDEGEGMPWLRFDSEGQSIFDAWDSEVQNRIRSTELSESFESHLSKYASMVPSVALVIHLALGGRGPVDGQSTKMAVRWAEYLESHAARLYSIAAAPERRLSKPLLKRLIKWPKDRPIRVRDIVRSGWSGLDDPEVVERVLDILIDAGWVRAVAMKPTTGRPTVDFVLHPQAAEFFKTYQKQTDKTDKTSGDGSFGSFGGSKAEGLQEKSMPDDRVRGVL
jgi:hypothetical protein